MAAELAPLNTETQYVIRNTMPGDADHLDLALDLLDNGSGSFKERVNKVNGLLLWGACDGCGIVCKRQHNHVEEGDASIARISNTCKRSVWDEAWKMPHQLICEACHHSLGSKAGAVPKGFNPEAYLVMRAKAHL